MTSAFGYMRRLIGVAYGVACSLRYGDGGGDGPDPGEGEEPGNFGGEAFGSFALGG